MALVALAGTAAGRGRAAERARAARATPVPSLQPRATQREWLRLVQRRHALQAAAGCRPLRAVFYAPTDWLRLATKLAANASPCAQYYISIPPLADAKTTFRSDQAWRIRALGPSFHALAEVHMPGWRAWVTQTGSSWYQAGVEARRRMAAAGFDVTAGDGWIVNEFSSGVRRDLPNARAEVRAFVHGLYDGAGGPPVKGGVFDIGLSQTGAGPGALDLSTYKAQLEDWFQDTAFWQDMSRYVADWSQELYGSVHNYAVPGLPLAGRRGSLEEWLEHQLVHVRLGGDATATATAFLDDAYSPLANAAWQWDVGSGFGWTVVSPELMEHYVSAQVYALRHFSALDGQARDHWGFAWSPHNQTGLSSADFAAGTGAILDRLAAAIHDSDGSVDASEPGLGACAASASWCQGDDPGGWFNDVWRTFSYWGRLSLSFDATGRTLSAGGVAGPLEVHTQLAGSGRPTPNTLVVTFASSSGRGGFSTGPSGPWTATLAVTIPAGADSTPAVYYSDTTAGAPTLTATALGTTGASLAATVVPAGPVRLTLAPSRLRLPSGERKRFLATAVDAYGNAAPAGTASWTVAPAALGKLSSRVGSSTVFRAGTLRRGGTLVVRLGPLSTRAAITVTAPARCVVPRLLRKTVPVARRLLRRGGCRLGSTTHAYSAAVAPGRVVAQLPRAGTRHRLGTRVRVVVSRGRRSG